MPTKGRPKGRRPKASHEWPATGQAILKLDGGVIVLSESVSGRTLAMLVSMAQEINMGWDFWLKNKAWPFGLVCILHESRCTIRPAYEAELRAYIGPEWDELREKTNPHTHMLMLVFDTTEDFDLNVQSAIKHPADLEKYVAEVSKAAENIRPDKLLIPRFETSIASSADDMVRTTTSNEHSPANSDKLGN
tara:strand:+ start:95 stop:667 length:573 start_codon:yes stop_codon:yes gene_type:complete